MAALTFVIIDSHSQEQESIANIICIAFYYCMRLCKYTGTTTDDQAFDLEDITFYIGIRCLDNALCSDLELEAATSTIYHITEQMNCHKDDVIAHTIRSDMLCCPVRATIRQLMIHHCDICCSKKTLQW